MCNDLFIKIIHRENGELTISDRLLSGSLSGAILITATYPLDLVAARLTSTSEFNGIMHCLKDTYVREGARGLYRGYIPSLCGVVPYTGSQFAFFEMFKTSLSSYFPYPEVIYLIFGYLDVFVRFTFEYF